MKGLLITALFFISVAAVFGQGELDEQQKIFIRNERTFGLLLNTDGYAISYRKGNRIDFFNKRIYEIDLGTFRHPKELKLSNPYYDTPGSFVYGKENFVFFLRGGIGHQKELFRKNDLGGVAVRIFYSGGPALVAYKPIYYKILYPLSVPYEFEIKEEKFDILRHEPSMIYSRASFFKGFDDLKALPGIYAKGGFNFEYSKVDKIIHAIEIGAQINVFPAKIPIMATEDNKFLYFSLFASYRFGVILDPRSDSNEKTGGWFSWKKRSDESL
jgi:hypothetical protein